MKHPLRLLTLTLLLAAPAAPALADAAPPREPPGSNLLPPGETMVQMVAESVVISLRAASGDPLAVEIEAVFAMRNQGGATEAMDVRFPLEPLDGFGDGWGERVLIDDFAAEVDGRAVPIREVLEPYVDGAPISWAVFPVTFEPERDVEIFVSYATQLYGDAAAQVDYLLESGSGWYGPIGSALVVLRLPYAASESNVFITNPWDAEPVPPTTFVGREARWHWRDLEPTAEDDLHLSFVWPADWQAILDLEAQTGADPSDVSAAVALAEAYREAGSERHGFMVSDPLYHLSRTAVEQALAYRPESFDLRVERAAIEVWRCESYPGCDLNELAVLGQSLADLELAAPSDERPLALQGRLAAVFDQVTWFATQQAQSATPDLAEATTTSGVSRPAPTLAPSRTPIPTTTPGSIAEPAAAGAAGFPEPISGAVGLAVGIGGGLAAGAVLRKRVRSK